jgi:hypothetical protein
MIGPGEVQRTVPPDPEGSLPLELFCADELVARVPWTDVPFTADEARAEAIPISTNAPRRNANARIASVARARAGCPGRRPIGYGGVTVMVPVMNPSVIMEYGSHGARQFQVKVPVVLK